MLTKPFVIYTKLRIYTSFVISKKLHIKHRSHLIFNPNSIRLIGTAADQKDPFRKKVDLDFPEKNVSVHTCENVYEKWKKDQMVYKLPQSGVHAEISYIDTMDYFNEKGTKPTKTVLCIHGIPGNYGVFSYLIKDLTKEGVRVVVPTFPGNALIYSFHVTFKGKYLFNIHRILCKNNIHYFVRKTTSGQ